SVFAADVDGDGDVDVLSALADDNKIALYLNNGSNNFTEQTISTNADRPESVFAADVDGDGDVDVLSASFDDKKIVLYETISVPVLTDLDPATFTESIVNPAAQIIDSDVTLTSDSNDFNGGNIIIDYTIGGGIENQLTVANIGTGVGQIGFDGTNITYEGNLIGNIDIINNGVNGNILEISLTTANATVAAVEALIEAISYQNISENPTASRIISITVNDGIIDSTPQTLEITVNAENNAPVLNNTLDAIGATADIELTVDEDTTPIGGVGNLVSEIVDLTANVTDIDTTPPPVTGIAITAVDETNGVWHYTTNGSTTWTPVGVVSETSALLLPDDANTRVLFAPTADFNGSITNGLTFRAWDQTFGTGGTNIDVSTNGETTAFSIDTDRVNVVVNPVNDAPTAADNTITIEEDNSHTFTETDFSFDDIDGDTLASITITTLPTAGTLQLNEIDVTANQIITAEDIPNLVFTPEADGNGTNYANFNFTVNDGTEESQTANTITIDVTPVNDAPVAADNTITIEEDSSHRFAETDFSFDDIDGDTLASITITTLPTTGTLQLNETDVTANQIITAEDIPNLVFTPEADGNGTNTNFNFTVNDGTENSQIANTITIDVTALNDAPTAADNTITIEEDNSHTFTETDFSFDDIDGDTLASITITTLPTAGTLQLNEIDVTANQIITAEDIPNLVFTPEADGNGTNYANFNFTVNDGTEESQTANTITIDVTPVNDAPTAADNTITINEDSSHTFAETEFGFSDIDGDSLASITISTPPTVGTLQLNGIDVTTNQVITAADIPNLVFAAEPNLNGVNDTSSFEFTVNDGIDDSEAANVINIDVTPNPSTISVNDIIVKEEDSIATFTITLDQPSNQPVTINYNTSDSTAIAPDDYTAITD
ncbi:tandem-95 repeat protein, partial [Dapis sp. BLCC M172]|uniref:beta strand repeat-containing protein n=1 Tax=Dapis sp. BLCC M172 TaxID=2975281 RepID=UPI003CEF9B58